MVSVILRSFHCETREGNVSLGMMCVSQPNKQMQTVLLFHAVSPSVSQLTLASLSVELVLVCPVFPGHMGTEALSSCDTVVFRSSLKKG